MAPLKQRRMNVVVIHIDHFSLLHFLAKGSDSSAAAATAAAARSNKCITIIYFVVSSLLHNSCSYCYNFSGSADSHQHRKLFIISKNLSKSHTIYMIEPEELSYVVVINVLYFYFTSPTLSYQNLWCIIYNLTA